MNSVEKLPEVKSLAAAIDAEICSLPVHSTSTERAVRQKYSRGLKKAEPGFIFDLARELLNVYQHRWIAYELIRAHTAAFHNLGEEIIEEFGQGINSWESVDSFARTLSGPAWLRGKISDDLILNWARSENVWYRRAALVSTVAWNVRSQGGPGDVTRTLAICRILVADHEDLVVKAQSWALRELVIHDPDAVKVFLKENENTLAARVKYEVGNKLRTGLKNPRR